MKQYYIEKNGQQSKPLTVEELQSKNISKQTLVWYEGLENWTSAENIPELEGLFKALPPPLMKTLPPVIKYGISENIEEEKSTFLSNPVHKIIVGALAIVVFTALIYSFSNKQQAEVINQTQEHALVIEQQQKMLEEQNAKIAEQERLEKERSERERKAAIEQSMKEVGEQLETAYKNLEKSKEQLNTATGFQLLRSSSERNAQINSANENVERWKGEVEVLEKELVRLRAAY